MTRRPSPWKPWPVGLVFAVFISPVVIFSYVIWALTGKPGFAPIAAVVGTVMIVWNLMEASYHAGMRAGADGAIVADDDDDEEDDRNETADGETYGFVSCPCGWSKHRALFADLHAHRREVHDA